MERPRIRPCCQEPENLMRSRLGPDSVVDICRVCGARHFRLKAEPGKLGTKGMPIGRR